MGPRPRVAAAGLAALAFLGGGCGVGSETDTNSDTLTVVSVLPLQGPGAARSRDLVDGEKLALAQAAGMAGAFTVNFRSLDDGGPNGSTRADAVAAARAAAQDRNAIAVIGGADPAATVVSVQTTNAVGLVQLSPVLGSRVLVRPAAFPSGHPTFALLGPTDPVQARLAVSAARRRGCRRVVALAGPDPADAGLARLVARVATTRDLRARSARLGARVGPAECVFVAAAPRDRPADALRAARGSRAIIGAAGLAELRTARDLARLGPRVDVLAPPPPSRPFAAAFRRAYGRTPGAWAQRGFAAMRLVLAAVRRAGEQGADRAAVALLLLRSAAPDPTLVVRRADGPGL